MKYLIVVDEVYYEIPAPDLVLKAMPSINEYMVEENNCFILNINRYSKDEVFSLLKRLNIVLNELLPTLTDDIEKCLKLQQVIQKKINKPFFINNDLRDLVYQNNLRHGFWDNRRTYEEFIRNIMGEFDETLEELHSDKSPTEVYFTKGNKPEGAPTELADIIIFILDYFGGSEPQIDIDEEFLNTADEHYQNEEYYEQMRKLVPWQYFIHIRDEGRALIAASEISHLLHGNDIYEVNGEKRGVPIELHSIIKLILQACAIYEIDIESELRAKIEYNNSRPKDYRKMGDAALLETNRDEVYSVLVDKGYGAYKELDEVIAERTAENELIMKKRQDRIVAEENESSAKKH